MKLVRVAFAVAVAVGTAAATAFGDFENVLLNPDFESGSLEPWYQDEVFTPFIDWNVNDEDAASGTYSAANAGDTSIRQDFVGVASDLILEVSFWVRTEHAICCPGLAGKFFYESGTVDLFHFETSETWSFVDVTSELDPGQVLTGISVFGFKAGQVGPEDWTRLDDVAVRIVPEPNTGLLLLISLALVCLARPGR